MILEKWKKVELFKIINSKVILEPKKNVDLVVCGILVAFVWREDDKEVVFFNILGIIVTVACQAVSIRLKILLRDSFSVSCRWKYLRLPFQSTSQPKKSQQLEKSSCDFLLFVNHLHTFSFLFSQKLPHPHHSFISFLSVKLRYIQFSSAMPVASSFAAARSYNLQLAWLHSAMPLYKER